MKSIIDLNGQWEFIADLDPKYHNDIGIHGSIIHARADINRRHWMKVQVPGVWQKYAERYDIFEGVCWFYKEFVVNDDLDSATVLFRFGAVNYLCRVFLNGVEIGGHETGYTEFVLDGTKYLINGRNYLSVMVDNRSLITKWPPCLGYFNYGGIHRGVSLEILREATLDDVSVVGDFTDGIGILHVKGRVRGYSCDPAKGLAFLKVLCQETISRISIDQDGNFRQDIGVNGIEPWTPDSPMLYDTTLQLTVDDSIQDVMVFTTGFKRTEIVNGRVKLNGSDIMLKGICYVYDSPVSGLTMTKEQIETDLDLLKETGSNAIRCHYPMDRVFYETCDRLGIMVWIEPTVYCYHPKDDATDTYFSDTNWTELAEQMIIEMIRTARNHVSVTIYGIGNECNTANPEAEGFFRKLARRIRENDPARLISYAALYGITGPIADMVDVLGINSYWGWYDKIYGGKGLKPEDIDQCDETGSTLEPIDLTPMRSMLDKVLDEGPKNLALILTEFGADSVPGYFSKSRDLWSEDYHAALLTEIFNLSEEYPQIIGTFPFCFTDYRDPSKFTSGYWNELNLKGIVTYERKKRMAFGAVKNYYRKADSSCI